MTKSDPSAASDAAHEALLRAITICGSQGALARICTCTAPNIWQLVKRKRRLPAEYVLAVEAKTGISRHELRPDIYPAPQIVTTAAA